MRTINKQKELCEEKKYREKKERKKDLNISETIHSETDIFKFPGQSSKSTIFNDFQVLENSFTKFKHFQGI